MVEQTEMVGPDGKPIRAFADRAAWAGWLAANHMESTGVWVRLANRGAPDTSVSYDEAVEVGLCYGWIDGQARRLDTQHRIQKFTRRSKRSIWSKRNRDRALALIERGEMQPAGLAEVQRAQQDGRWESAYDPPSEMTVPDDLRAALDENPAAGAFFGTLDSRNRYAILFRLQTAKHAETRAKRIREFVDMLAKHEKLYGGR
jgi:uncharacterized protein YdeI (YjbR/CyaY-like superfamily)